MGNISITNTLTNGSVIDADNLNTNFTDVTSVVNGSIDNTNVATAAAIAASKLDSATFNAAGIVDKTTAQTLTNKRTTKREVTVTSSATPTPNCDTTDIYTITALAAAATFGAPTGTPTQGQCLLIRIKDNATARALGWNAIYRAGTDIALPTTTVISKTMYLGFIYSTTDTKWDLVAFVNNI